MGTQCNTHKLRGPRQCVRWLWSVLTSHRTLPLQTRVAWLFLQQSSFEATRAAHLNYSPGSVSLQWGQGLGRGHVLWFRSHYWVFSERALAFVWSSSFTYFIISFPRRCCWRAGRNGPPRWDMPAQAGHGGSCVTLRSCRDWECFLVQGTS